MKTGLVNFIEEGMPWTKVFGEYELVEKDDGKNWPNKESHWKIKLEDGTFTHIPELCVLVKNTTQ